VYLTQSDNVGDDCPVFDGLFDYCSISAGGSMGAFLSIVAAMGYFSALLQRALPGLVVINVTSRSIGLEVFTTQRKAKPAVSVTLTVRHYSSLV
jgi:hypothetical protein